MYDLNKWFVLQAVETHQGPEGSRERTWPGVVNMHSAFWRICWLQKVSFYTNHLGAGFNNVAEAFFFLSVRFRNYERLQHPLTVAWVCKCSVSTPTTITLPSYLAATKSVLSALCVSFHSL